MQHIGQLFGGGLAAGWMCRINPRICDGSFYLDNLDVLHTMQRNTLTSLYDHDDYSTE